MAGGGGIDWLLMDATRLPPAKTRGGSILAVSLGVYRLLVSHLVSMGGCGDRLMTRGGGRGGNGSVGWGIVDGTHTYFWNFYRVPTQVLKVLKES